MARTGHLLRPTFTPGRADAYRRRGGPWDRGPLPAGFVRSSRAAVVDDAGILDPDGLEGAVAALAGRLRRSGVRRGQVVAWQLPNSAEVVVLYRACWRVGAIAAPVHHRMGEAEVAAALGQDPRMFAAQGGEDFELCFCCSPAGRDAVDAALAPLGAVPVTWVGQVRASAPGERARAGFRDLSGLAGYEHSF